MKDTNVSSIGASALNSQETANLNLGTKITVRDDLKINWDDI